MPENESCEEKEAGLLDEGLVAVILLMIAIGVSLYALDRLCVMAQLQAKAQVERTAEKR